MNLDACANVLGIASRAASISPASASKDTRPFWPPRCFRFGDFLGSFAACVGAAHQEATPGSLQQHYSNTKSKYRRRTTCQSSKLTPRGRGLFTEETVGHAVEISCVGEHGGCSASWISATATCSRASNQAISGNIRQDLGSGETGLNSLLQSDMWMRVSSL